MKYTYTQDPGHGWVAVPTAELFALGVADQISTYSYISRGTAYLEEDCDMAVWWHAYKRVHGVEPVLNRFTVEHTRIRDYSSYTPNIAKHSADMHPVQHQAARKQADFFADQGSLV